MTSIAMYASMSNDLDTQLEKLSRKLKQNSLFSKCQSRQYYFSTKSVSLSATSTSIFSIPKETRPKSLGVKKMVRFADSLGLELVTVKILPNPFINESYSYYQSEEDEEESDEFQSDSTDSPTENSDETEYTTPATQIVDPNSFVYDNLNFTWQCLFEQPGISPDFYSKLNQSKVLLEGIYTSQFKLNGIVRVQNLSFHKRVFIRYTLNNWVSHTDSECFYLMNGTNDSKQTDRFKFSIVLDKPGLIQSIDENLRRSGKACSPVLKLELAICYEARSSDYDGLESPCEESYWDNNDSKNYQYDCFFKIISPFKL